MHTLLALYIPESGNPNFFCILRIQFDIIKTSFIAYDCKRLVNINKVKIIPNHIGCNSQYIINEMIFFDFIVTSLKASFLPYGYDHFLIHISFRASLHPCDLRRYRVFADLHL